MNAIVRRNAALNAIGEAFWGFQANLVLPSIVLVVLLRHFGATQKMVGSITAIEGAAFMLPQLLGMYLFRSRRHLKRGLIWWHLVLMIPALPLIGLVALLGTRLGMPDVAIRWTLLGGYAWFAFTIGTVLSVWFDWIARLFDRSIRGTVMGVSFGLSQTLGCGGAIVASRLIAYLGAPVAYGVLYLVATIFALLSMLMFAFVHDPEPEIELPAGPTLGELMERFWISFREPNFRRYLIGRALASWGFCVLPLITAYYALPEGGGLSDDTVVAAGGAMALASALTHPLIGRLGDVRGHRLGMLIAICFQVAALCVALTTGGAVSCFVTFALVGVGSAAAFLTHQNLLFETCPHDHRLAHITIGTLLLAPTAILGPLVWAQLANAFGSHVVFAGSLAFLLAGLVWLTWCVREPRHETVAGAAN